MSFADLPVHPALQKALEEKGYADPTPVQALVVSEEHKGRDLLVSSRTGSGKTIAFGLVLANSLLPEDRFGPPTRPLALVVAPTRELAQQVQRELSWLYAGAGARVISCVGGMDVRREQQALRDGAHIVVGTPGRLCDHLERKKLDLSGLKGLVLDEADEMLDMGFRDELERILQDAPAERQTLLFSATLPSEIRRLAESYQRDPVRLAADAPKAAHADIEYRAHLIALREREHAVVNTLRCVDAPSAIVFCATREAVSRLHAALAERGFEAVALSGELSQNERNRALKALRDGRARVLVATDVAARGLDLPAVGLVIHADLPNDPAVLAHRSGRTGRAGRKGVSVVLSPAGKRRTAERLLFTNGIRVGWTEIPSPDDVRRKDLERFESEIETLVSGLTEEDLQAARPIAEKLSPEQLAAALARRFRESLPAPEELPLSAGLADEASRRDQRIKRASTSTPAFPASRPFPAPTSSASSSPDHESGPRPVRVASSGPRAVTGPRTAAGPRTATGTVWFRVNVGRESNADPKWLLPMLCRRGQVGREEIGAIRILPDESRFEIAASAAERFERSVQKPDPKDRSLRIDRSEAPFGGPSSGGPRKPYERGEQDFRSRPERADRPSRAPFTREPYSGASPRPFAKPNRNERPTTFEKTERFERSQRFEKPGYEKPAFEKSGFDRSDRFPKADRPEKPARFERSDNPDRPRFEKTEERKFARTVPPSLRRAGEGSDRPSTSMGGDRPARPPYRKSFDGASDRGDRGGPSARPVRPFSGARTDGGFSRPKRPFGAGDGARPRSTFPGKDGPGSDRPYRKPRS